MESFQKYPTRGKLPGKTYGVALVVAFILVPHLRDLDGRQAHQLHGPKCVPGYGELHRRPDVHAVLDIREKSSMADTIVIGTGTSSRHVMALAHNLVTELKKQDIRPLNDCHRGEGCWAVVDLGDIIIHLFTADARQEYNLEELWAEPKSKRTRKAPQKSA